MLDQGIRVLGFWNSEVENYLVWVIQSIDAAIDEWVSKTSNQ